MNLTNEEKYWVWLTGIEGMGAVTFYNILKVFIDAKTACENYRDIPKQIRLPQKLKQNLMRDMNIGYRDRLFDRIVSSKQKVLTRLNQSYPTALADIDNPPPVLYFKGDIPTLDTMAAVGIVGTRKPTRDGVERAESLAYHLAEQNVVIVSGMARGIDTASHQGAIKAKGKTIAVLGSGLDVIYPAENRKIYEQIIEYGAVVSEFLPGTQPKAGHFPMRNRIIAGLSETLVAGEGGIKSGARITVDYALNQGKNVYVLPCNMESSVAELPGYLIETGASLANSAYDIMRMEGWQTTKIPEKKDVTGQLPDDQQLVHAILRRENLSADELCQQTGIGIRNMNMLLTVMELRGVVEAMPGGIFRVNK